MNTNHHLNRPVFEDDFSRNPDNAYPDGWACENDCEWPFRQGVVKDGAFHICPASHTNKHLPLTPPLADFRLELAVAGNPFFSTAGLDIYFRYDRETRRGLLLRYAWGICGGQTHYAQKRRRNMSVPCSIMTARGRTASANCWRNSKPADFWRT